jgi:hypothetical protein
MPPLGFSDEELNAITTLAAVLPHNMRSEFLQRVANKLSEYPPQGRGAGLVYRLAVEVQRDFLRGGLIAVGVGAKSGKYGRAQSLRQGRRR